MLGDPCFARRNKDWEALDLFLSFADVTRVLFQTSEVFFSSNAAGAGGGARGGGWPPSLLEYNQRTSKPGRPKLKIQLRDRELVLEAESLVFNEEVNKKMNKF